MAFGQPSHSARNGSESLQFLAKLHACPYIGVLENIRPLKQRSPRKLLPVEAEEDCLATDAPLARASLRKTLEAL